jgi:hypothetical protein
MYIQAVVQIKGITPLQQSREMVSEHPRNPKETHSDHENRCWQFRAHVNSKGYVYHPGMAFKKSIVGAARYLGTQIAGQGKKTYTKKFESALTVIGDLDLGVKHGDVEKRSVYGASNGKPGSDGRVWKHFPTLAEWGGKIELHIYDEIITKDILMEHLAAAGAYIGVGTWRPEKGGEHGRFTAKLVSWKEIG